MNSRKGAIALAVIGVATFIAAAWLIEHHTAAQREICRQNISAVLEIRLRLRADCALRDPRGKPTQQIESNRYAAALRKTDTSDCPRDFQFAWLEYVHAWERLAHYGPIDRGFDLSMTVAGVKGAPEVVPGVARRAELRNTDEPWFKVERIALAYGVSPR